MDAWLLWLIAAAVLAAAETSTMSFVLVMFAGGSLAASITAAAGAPLLAQVIVAAVVSVALLAIARPIIRRHLDKPAVKTGSEALVGQEAVVVREVDAQDGRVRLNGGEWSARTLERDHVLPAGTAVRVARISGATAFVVPEQSLPSTYPNTGIRP